MTRLSIVMPALNVESYIAAAIQSVVLQTFTSWNLTVIDDGSTDRTAKIARKWAADNPRIGVWSLGATFGIARCVNAGETKGRSDLIMIMPADDTLSETYLELCVKGLDADPSKTIAYSEVVEFDDRTRKTLTIWGPVFDSKTLHETNTIPGCAVWRRSLFDAVGGWPTDFPHGCEDWAFWVKCNEAELLNPVQIARPLYHHRIRKGSLSESIEPHMSDIRERIAALHHRSAPRGCGA